ncbi:hypothetical protein Zymop_0405 [Zymomonas mobilis subsp. pomaceae ATCC 29192]|uniref:Uncharacterized protein n=1 Tax=Zymomonas mobilis subsp. pomaceae (strain ATCC 29192 / DSM 22645 / JCM 10191 / CCUG 17912 / NBRC 13757 / NCIMB 11200 / NRRL B-4491 / Barker I) TaxID=579138 RepID=F8EV20_ZYMMT|nr:hypothetical protein Zymop_0405 [Zymomonas mobilis subsp. pomaceae ATCC 29192]
MSIHVHFAMEKNIMVIAAQGDRVLDVALKVGLPI